MPFFYSDAGPTMSRLRVISLIFVTACLACALGFAIGFFQGMGAYGIIDATPKAALAVGSLHAMEKGNNEPITLLLESDIDRALGMYPLFQKAWWYPLFTSGWLIVEPSQFENYVKRAATYRKMHPSPLSGQGISEPLDKSSVLPDDQKEMFSEIKKFQAQVNAVVRQYAE